MFVHGVDAAVARRLEARAHFVDVELLADIQYQAAAKQKACRRQAVQGGGDRHYQNAMFQLRQAIKRGNSLRNDVLVR
ncbi:hypothetical protein D9M68_910890 [compost metagenome]